MTTVENLILLFIEVILGIWFICFVIGVATAFYLLYRMKKILDKIEGGENEMLGMR